MKKIHFVLFGLMFLSVAAVYAYDDGDFQVWNTDTEELKINDKLKASVEEEFRWGDDASEFFYHHYDAGVSYTFNQCLNIGGGYRQIYELRKGKFKPENAPYLTTTLSLAMKGFAFDTRSRLEYRHFGFQDDSWRYRNKFTLKLLRKFTKMEIQPYVSDEVLFAFGNSHDEFNQNRFASGLGMKLSNNLRAEIYYMLVSSKSNGEWKDANVLGTKIKLAF